MRLGLGSGNEAGNAAWNENIDVAWEMYAQQHVFCSATFCPISLLTRVDLPALGVPSIAARSTR